MIEYTDKQDAARIKVIGVGGGGGNAINTMVAARIEGVEFIAANTDVQSLRASRAGRKIQLGEKLTKGLGAGTNPDVGRRAAEEAHDQILDALRGADMVFVAAGLGKGTGTGASPFIASLAAELDCLVVAVACTPFAFEGTVKMKNAHDGLAKLREAVDTVIVIPNERLPGIIPREMTITDAFSRADDVLAQSVRSVSDLITVPGEANLDFADVSMALKGRGKAFIGMGEATGEDRALKATEAALHNPLLGEASIEGATAVLLNVTTGPDGLFSEMMQVSEAVQGAVKNADTSVNWGHVPLPEMKDMFRVTVIAAGFGEAHAMRAPGPKMFAIGGRKLGEHELPTPATLQVKRAAAEAASAAAAPPAKREVPTYQRDESLLDTPTYLRRNKGASLFGRGTPVK
jgi:cell division protein FtsZ